MFSALKYCAVDYLYEKMARQRCSFEWLSIHIPSCLYQDKIYYHDGGFADFKYRRPWTRVSVDSALIMMNFSVLDHWKASLYVEDFLEKKPISSIFVHIDNEDIEVVPSSNVCSQFSIEDVYLLMKNNKEKWTHDNHLQSTYVPIVLKEHEGDLYIEEELIFTNTLAQYSKWLPNLRTLLSRLSIFQVQDPLLNSKGDSIREEDIFRECFTFKESMTSQAKGKELREDFCKMTLSNEETLVLPLKLQSYETADLRRNTEIPTCLALKILLQVTPEAMPNESESYKITCEDIKADITSDIEISQYCPTDDVCTRQSSSAVEFSKSVSASYSLLHAGELEIQLTPSCRSEKVHVNSLYAELQSEPISPFTKSILITESTKEYRYLEWQSEKYQHAMNSLLLTEHQTFVPTCQQLLVTDLKKLLSIHEDTSVFSPPEEDGWINLTENLALLCVLETLSPVDLDGEKSLVGTNVEEFSKIATFQLQKWLDESSITKTKVESISALDYGDTKDSCWSLQQNETFPRLSLGTTSGVPPHSANTSPEKHARKDKLLSETENLLLFRNQEEEKNYQLQPTDCEKVSTEANSTSGNKKTSPFELPRNRRDDFDLLSNFIMLRSKHMIDQTEETSNVDIQEAVPDTKEESPAFENLNSSVATVLTENQAKEDEDFFTIQIKASESQFQAYHILEATVAPVLKELGMHNWRFATLCFDDTRFFLKQQEKMLSDTFKQDINDAKNIAIFKHAAVLHLLVTVRDLLLTCSLNAALGYLSKAKDRYKDFLGSSMDNIWRQLNIVQFARQREHEANPKIAELRHQIFKWVQKNTNKQEKVVIVTRTDFDDETATLIKTVSMVQGLKAVYLNSEKRGALLESKKVINSLKSCSCVIVHNQHIGPDFPWTHFSLVVDYNYSGNSFWIDVCRKLNVCCITFITALPETVETDNFECALLEVQIPYVFLTTEGLLSTPEILQILESKYNITFIERSCSEALQFFGSTDRYVVMTLDECTAIIMQNIEELSYEKSSDYLVLRLTVLSLQYSCCWIILYSRERLNSEYSLAGKTLTHLALVYSALVSFAQKSEDFEVKVALTPGVEETALLIRQIADYILMTSKRHPQEWLDKSWLSVLPSEAEKCLLTFPCMNPLVAQVMLKKSSSLKWLLSTTLDQLQKLLPEVPEKVLKHFNDITSLYTLSSPTDFKHLEETVPLQDNMNSANMNSAISSCSQVSFSEALLSSFQGQSQFNEYTRCFNKVQNSKNCSPGYYPNESCAPLKPNTRQSFMAPSLSYQEGVYAFQGRNQNIDSSAMPEEGKQYLQFLKKLETKRRASSPLLTQHNLGGSTHINFEAKIPSFEYSQGDSNAYLENSLQKGICLPKVTKDQKLHVPVLIKNPTHQESHNLLGVTTPPPMKQHNSNQDSKQSWYLVSNRKTFPFQQSSSSFLGEFGRPTYSSPQYQCKESYQSMQKIDFSLHDPSFCKGESHPNRFLQITGEHIGKKRPNLLSSNQREQVVSAAGLEFSQILELKKRRLTFEKDPGRTDGQTRLKFF